jgi:hypothetical protein
VAELRSGRDHCGAASAARARLDHDPVVLLLARFHAAAGPDRGGDDGQVCRLPGPARRAADEHGAHVHRGAHVRSELGSALARRPGPIRRCVAGRPAGLVRGGDGPPVRRAPGGGRLAGLQRDAAIRRGHAGRDRRGLGPDHQGRGARGRRSPAVLRRRRGLGGRDQRPRQRVPADGHGAAVRLPRPACLPGGG